MNRSKLARTAPFALYMAFLAAALGASSLGFGVTLWLYPVKVFAVSLALWIFRGEYRELLAPPSRRAVISSVLMGVLVFLLWIHLDQGWLNLGVGSGFDPRAPDGGVDWVLAAFRLAGASLVVPLMEELFWRSFLLRWLENQDFLSLPASALGVRAILLSSVLFGSEHSLWFAGILAGLAYAWLYRSYNNLWAPIVAHTTTNLILGIWVLRTGAWPFW